MLSQEYFELSGIELFMQQTHTNLDTVEQGLLIFFQHSDQSIFYTGQFDYTVGALTHIKATMRYFF